MEATETRSHVAGLATAAPAFQEAAARMRAFGNAVKATLFDNPELHRELIRDLYREESPEAYALLAGEHQPRETETDNG